MCIRDSVNTIPCPNTVAKIMDLSPDDQVYYIERVRNVKGIPLSLHKSYIPVSLCPKLENSDFCNEQLCEILSKNYNLYRTSVSVSYTHLDVYKRQHCYQAILQKSHALTSAHPMPKMGRWYPVRC